MTRRAIVSPKIHPRRKGTPLPSDQFRNRRGNAAPKIIIAVVVFLGVFGLIRYARSPAQDITVLGTQRVNAKDLEGQPLRIERIKSILSAEGLGGLGGISSHLRRPPPGAEDPEEKDADESAVKGTEGLESKVLTLEQDTNGAFLLVNLRLSRDYLEKQGKISNLLAVVSTPDIQLTRTEGGGVEPIFLVSGLRQENQAPQGTETQFNFGGGNTLTIRKTAPAQLWMAAGQIKQTQELSNYVELTCLFGRPPGSGELSLQVLGTPNVALAQ